MVEAADLTARELSMLAREAGEECYARFARIALASDPDDHALQELLARMAREAYLQVQAFEKFELPPAPAGRGTVSFEDLRKFIRKALPSLDKGFGEGILHRDIALFYAESLEEEASRFYRMLAGHARESRSRELFTDLSERERGKLRFLREVVLQS